MKPTSTLDPTRRAQLRAFLVTEAASDAAESPDRSLVHLRGRRIAAGAVAALVLGSVLATSTLRPGGADAALAITTQGEWTTVRLSDVDADARAVVDELVAAGIDARIAPVAAPDTPPGYTGLLVGVLDDPGSEFAYGLSILMPAATDAPPPSGSEPVEVTPDNLEELHGVRSDGEESFSIRSGSDAVILVHPRD